MMSFAQLGAASARAQRADLFASLAGTLAALFLAVLAEVFLAAAWAYGTLALCMWAPLHWCAGYVFRLHFGYTAGGSTLLGYTTLLVLTYEYPPLAVLWAYPALAPGLWRPVDVFLSDALASHLGRPPLLRTKMFALACLLILTHVDAGYRGGPASAVDIYILFLMSGFNLEGNGRSGRKESKPSYQAVVKYRFHNVQGLSDDNFRAYYLSQAREECDVLVLAETNCNSTQDEARWAQDWKGRSAVFWASALGAAPDRGGSHRGMAIMVANSVPLTEAHVVFADPGGRGIALRCKVHDRPTLIVGLHADGKSDTEQKLYYDWVQSQIPAPPHDTPTDVVLLGDFT